MYFKQKTANTVSLELYFPGYKMLSGRGQKNTIFLSFREGKKCFPRPETVTIPRDHAAPLEPPSLLFMFFKSFFFSY